MAKCPVLTVSMKPDVKDESERVVFKKILCPLDFSSCSIQALEFALSLAEEAGGKLTLLHVLESVFEDAGDMAGFAVSDYRDYVERSARERLAKAVPEEARQWCEPEAIITSGRSYQKILQHAGERDSDLIVMGVQGRSAVDLMLFGSTTQHVIRAAECPVLTIRSG